MVANEDAVCTMGKVATAVYQPPSVVTSTAFDDDDVFQAVARAMIFRYENEGLSEREAINATLVTSEDKRGFLESLDMRSTNMYLSAGIEELGDSAINEIVELTRVTFGETLKLLWRESITGYDSQSSGMLFEEDTVDGASNEYRHRLKTPKNDLHSPIRVFLGSSCMDKAADNSAIKPKSSGRQRRRFFPDIEPRCRSRIRLDFKLAASGEQVKSLQLDGQRMPSMIGYAPPSPISTTAHRVRMPRT